MSAWLAGAKVKKKKIRSFRTNSPEGRKQECPYHLLFVFSENARAVIVQTCLFTAMLTWKFDKIIGEGSFFFFLSVKIQHHDVFFEFSFRYLRLSLLSHVSTISISDILSMCPILVIPRERTSKRTAHGILRRGSRERLRNASAPQRT